MCAFSHLSAYRTNKPKIKSKTGGTQTNRQTKDIKKHSLKNETCLCQKTNDQWLKKKGASRGRRTAFFYGKKQFSPGEIHTHRLFLLSKINNMFSAHLFILSICLFFYNKPKKTFFVCVYSTPNASRHFAVDLLLFCCFRQNPAYDFSAQCTP